MKKGNLLIHCMFIMIAFMVLVFAIIIYIQEQELLAEKSTDAQLVYWQDMSDCNNQTTLRDTVSCEIDNIRPYYIYRLNDDRNYLTDTVLLTFGGDCLDWTRYYEKSFKQKKLLTERIYIDINESTNHVFLMVSNNQGYCIVDQRDYMCFMYG